MAKTEKKIKKKGPIRTEAIIPILILVVLFGLYFKYYFDSHLRYGIAYGATQAHGAEVNIDRLKTDFLAPSLSIYNIQITDKSDPEFNIVQVGEVRLQLLWDALLRGKFVIPESSILKIQSHSKRKRRGRILPPPAKSSAKGQVEQAAETTISQLKQKNESNILADVFSVAGGTDVKDQLKKMENEIQSQQKIKKLGEELKVKEKQWKQKIDELPDESELKQLVKKVEGLKIDTSNPKALQASLKSVDAVYKEARAKYKTIEGAKKSLSADIKKYEDEYKSLENLVKADIQGITEKLNIPSLDPKEINKMLLGNLVAAQLGNLYRYKQAAEKYMPTKTAEERKAEKEEQALTPTERAEGIDFRFPKKKSYPQFWLQKAQISSSSKQGQAGDLSGTLANLTNNPKHLGLPATFDFKGGFPHQKILDVEGNITVDHTTDSPEEKGFVKVGSFPVEKNVLTRSDDVELGYNKANGSSKIEFLMKNKSLQLSSQSLFSDIDYYSSAKKPKVAELLAGVTKGLDNLDLNVRARGSWDDLSLNINSNLGQKLAAAIKAQISGEIAKARAQVKNHIEGLINGEKSKLKGQLAKIEQQLGVSLQSREAAIDSVKKSVDEKKKSATQKEKKKIEKKAKDKLKNLIKGIKF